MACYTTVFNHRVPSDNGHLPLSYVQFYTFLQIIHVYKRVYDTILYINQNVSHFTHFITILFCFVLRRTLQVPGVDWGEGGVQSNFFKKGNAKNALVKKKNTTRVPYNFESSGPDPPSAFAKVQSSSGWRTCFAFGWRLFKAGSRAAAPPPGDLASVTAHVRPPSLSLRLRCFLWKRNETIRQQKRLGVLPPRRSPSKRKIFLRACFLGTLSYVCSREMRKQS